MLVTLAGAAGVGRQRHRAVALDPAAGSLLWEHPVAHRPGHQRGATGRLGGDRVFLSASYGQGAAVVEVRREGDRLAARIVWANSRMKNKFTSSLLHEGYLYGLDESILACVDAATGEQNGRAAATDTASRSLPATISSC